MNAEISETVTSTEDLLMLEQQLIVAGAPFAVATVIRVSPPTSTQVGAQALVEGNGTLHGWIGGGCSQAIVIEAARQAMRAGQPRRVRISNEPSAHDPDVEAHAMPCASNGAMELFIQPTVPAPLVVVFGATPAAQEACVLAQRVGFRTCIAADSAADIAREGASRYDAAALDRAGASFALIATQGDDDEDALEAALRSGASAVLLIASRRKAGRLSETMRLRGIDDARLAALHAPAGPAIHAHTPQEIALGAVAGLVALRHELAQAAALARQGEVATEAVPPLPPCEAIGVTGADAGRYVNPVCGMSIEIAKALHVVEYAGRKVYFCCDCCKAEFERAPERYLAAASQRSD